MKKISFLSMLVVAMMLTACSMPFGEKDQPKPTVQIPNVEVSATEVAGKEAVAEMKTVQEYLREAEEAKELLRLKLENENVTLNGVDENDGISFLNLFVETAHAQDEPTVEELLAIINSSLEKAEAVAGTPEELEAVEQATEGIDEDIEEAVEESSDEEVKAKVNSHRIKWVQRLQQFEAKFKERFGNSEERQEKRAERKESRIARQEKRAAYRAELHEKVETGELTKKEAQETMKQRYMEMRKEREAAFEAKVREVEAKNPGLAEKMKDVRSKAEEKREEIKEMREDMKEQVESGETTKREAHEGMKEAQAEARQEMKEEVKGMKEEHREGRMEKFEENAAQKIEKIKSINPDAGAKLEAMMKARQDRMKQMQEAGVDEQ